MHTHSRTMKPVCNKNLDVFDFKDDDESSGVALRISSKLRSAAIDKYTFLATAAAGEDISAEELKYVPSLGIDASNITQMATTLIEDTSAEVVADSDDDLTVAEQPQPQPQFTPQLRTDLSESEVNVPATSASPSNNKLNSVIHNLLHSLPEIVDSEDLSSRSKSHLKCPQKQEDAVEMDPDEIRSLCERSYSSSDIAEDCGVIAEPSSDHCTSEREMDSEDVTAVVFYPDYLLYRGGYFTDSVISFTSTSIKMEASSTDGDDRVYKCKWGIEDILHIRSHWYEQVEMAMIVIYVLTNDKILAENVECTSGTELKFAVIGSQWCGRYEAITSLNVTYKSLWTSMLESQDTVFGHSGEPFSQYLPNFSRPLEEVVYPKGDADAVSISKRDFDLLQPDTFVNDTIIDFYIKYLKNKIKPDERHRFHFFNSFFFRKLADPDKDPLDASQGEAAFQRVKKWTRKVNLFEKDYVFIPINYNYHWSLIVICHLGDVATYRDEDINKSTRVPCVLHMDSFRGSHTGLKGLLQSYLKEEWKERKQEASEDICSRFDTLRFFSLELPQQQNLFDCGLFLLHYVELFLEEAPLHFNPFKITESSNFLNVDWFPPAAASLKRVVIQKLICDLLENPHQEFCSAAANEEQCHLGFQTKNVHKDDPSMASKPSFESESLLGTQLPDFNHTTSFDECKGSLHPIEEDMGGGGVPFVVYSQTESAIQQKNGIMGNNSDLLSQDFVTWNAPVIAEHIKNSSESSSETSTSGCEDLVEIVDELESEEVGLKKKRDELRDYTQIVDGNAAADDDTCYMDMILPEQNQTKKMRMTEP